MRRKKLVGLGAAGALVVAVALAVPTIVGAADPKEEYNPFATPASINVRCVSGASTGRSDVAVTVGTGAWGSDVRSVTVTGPGVNATWTSPNRTATIPAGTPGFTCSGNTTFTFTSTKAQGQGTTAGPTVTKTVTGSPVPYFNGAVSPSQVSIGCYLGVGHNRTAIALSAVNRKDPLASVTVSGPGLTAPVTLNASNSWSATIAVNTLGFPCSPSPATLTYSFQGRGPAVLPALGENLGTDSKSAQGTVTQCGSSQPLC